MTRRALTPFARLLALALALAASALGGPGDDAYRESVEQYRRDREATLKAPDGWLSVAGLFWLRPGQTVVGGAPSADVLLPAGSPPTVGTLTLLDDGRATFRPEAGVAVLLDGKPFEGGPIRSDADGARPGVLAVGDLRLILLKRGDRFALRLKDNQSPIRRDFTGLRWFPIVDDWRVVARFTPHPLPTKITFETIVGGRDVLESPGYATFERDGKSYRLDAALDDGRLWFVFRDATAGRTTPANARQLVADLPVADQVILDFNRAIDLPCAYTPHATCPIAPPQNRLDLPITAGEKIYDPNPRSAFRLE